MDLPIRKRPMLLQILNDFWRAGSVEHARTNGGFWAMSDPRNGKAVLRWITYRMSQVPLCKS